jgi:site-specific DNA-methyltransferase (adenine-specific)
MLKIEYVDINSIKPYKNNAKLHPQEQIEQIKKSIEQFGMDDPIGIWKDEIVEGHGRLIACKELGYTEVPIIRLDHLTDEERKAYTLAHNKLTMNSDFDLDVLDEELKSIDTIDMSDFGFDIDLDMDEEQEIVEDEVPEVPEEPKAKLGDIYQLGNHRLMCGDSTSEEYVAKLMNGVKADMVFTDPPYGVSYEGGLNEKKKQQIKNDNVTGNDLYNFLYKVFINAKNNTNEKSAFYVFYATKTTKEFINAFLDSGLKQRSIIAWYKQGGGFGDFMAQYMNAYEPCIYGSNGESVNWYGASNEKTVWEIDKEKKCDLHPTMKPIEVVARAIKNSSKKDEKVLDLFGGSGSTLIACEQLNRKCYMMELDPHYIDVIIQRWENFTGEKAIKIGGIE